VNLARWFKIDAESALRAANTRFRNRFESLEAEIRNEGKDISDLTLNELDELWVAIKQKERK
jgi:uncharacterized protein YabN with tetrapyrrole methylase and pyrophosphatase domain